MALSVVHSTTPDGTFSGDGEIAWTAEHTLNGTVSTSQIADDAVTYAKLQNVSATDKVLGRSSSGAGDVEEIACTSAGRALLDDANAAAQRTTLGVGPTVPGGVFMTGCKYVLVRGGGLATGDNDLVLSGGGAATVPTGKRWLVGVYFGYNDSAGTIAFYPTVKISGTYYRLASTATVGTAAASTSTVGYIAEAGETLAVNVATTNGLNVIVWVVEFDSTIAVKSAKLLSLATGDNTVYTAPANTNAMIIGNTFAVGGVNLAALSYVNSSGGTRTIRWHVVPSGSAVAAAHRITATISVTNLTRNSNATIATLNSGDFINLNTDANTATQIAWVNVMEIPN